MLVGIIFVGALVTGVVVLSLNNVKLKAKNSKLKVENDNLQYELGKTLIEQDEKKNQLAREPENISVKRIESIRDKFINTSKIPSVKQATKADVEAFYASQMTNNEKGKKLER